MQRARTSRLLFELSSFTRIRNITKVHMEALHISTSEALLCNLYIPYRWKLRAEILSSSTSVSRSVYLEVNTDLFQSFKDYLHTCPP